MEAPNSESIDDSEKSKPSGETDADSVVDKNNKPVVAEQDVNLKISKVDEANVEKSGVEVEEKEETLENIDLKDNSGDAQNESFTYTSLGQVKSEDMDDQQDDGSKMIHQSARMSTDIGGIKQDDEDDDSRSNQKSNDLVVERPESRTDSGKLNINEIELTSEETASDTASERKLNQSDGLVRLQKVELTTATATADEDDEYDDDATRNLTFDQVIDKLRENRISNKDICNYILNLLVGGEFDLEKNFVIQNVTSILKMIQVIKCANPSLKVNCSIVKNWRSRYLN